MTATMLQRVESTEKEKTDRKKRGCAKTKLRAAMQHAVLFQNFLYFLHSLQLEMSIFRDPT